jgi:hypothetical protein
MGLLSRRWTWIGPSDFSHPAADGSDLICSHFQALESIAINVHLKSTVPNSAEPEIPIAVCLRKQGGCSMPLIHVVVVLIVVGVLSLARQSLYTEGRIK